VFSIGKGPYHLLHWKNEKTIITYFHRKYQRANDFASQLPGDAWKGGELA